MEIVRTTLLCEHLEQWIKKTLGDVGRNRLRLRLDEHNTGYVTLKSFQEFARDMTLKDAVRLYCADPQFPLLVWISDDLEVNASKVAYAQARGVSVVQISSTKTAKAWIKVNKSLLKAHDSPRSLRFVSDQNRYELHRNGTVTLNNEAGEQIMKFIREEGIYAPILILTSGQSIHLTRYVESYDMTGSVLWDGRGFYDFAAALGARRKSDRIWMGYGGRYPDGRPL
ncbi:hypothetical protein D9613_006305 [Agrocybe pediades]|uniref:Uncharacterized protein n=1 Tax=Agrocybe pediades TaxID=84607 RepID=A0A8H4VRL3_9AGAR|nr:hypothetical protein D9613_006305 [Agrocybe pediades]